MEISREPTQAEIVSFLGTRTGSQMVQLVNSLYEPLAQFEFAKAMVLAPNPVVDSSSTPEKAKKGLNGFVGFRCYYIRCPAFKQYPMSKLSSVAGKMWKFDPNHSVWTLMTKAWSVIRDQIGKKNAPLDDFLRIICPYLNLPDPEIYLELQGWSVSLNNEGELQLHRDILVESSSISARCADMSLSVEDIISYCQKYGFALDFVHDKNATSPTFLAQSHQQASGKGSKAKQAIQVAEDVHEIRVLAKKQRRAKRQNLRNTGLAPMLQNQIVSVHVSDDDDVPAEDDLEQADPQFYNQIGNILTNNTFGGMTGNMSNNYVAVNNITSNMGINYVAVNNIISNMGSNYAAVPVVPTQNSTQPPPEETDVEDEEVEDEDEEAEVENEQSDVEYEQTESNDEQMDFEDEQTGSDEEQMDFEGGETEFEDEPTTESDKAFRDLTDYNAFRNGANKSATLPQFHGDTL